MRGRAAVVPEGAGTRLAGQVGYLKSRAAIPAYSKHILVQTTQRSKLATLGTLGTSLALELVGKVSREGTVV